MSKKNGPPLQIDLAQFTLHLDLKGKKPISLLFNTPSRRFYLSLIALVAMEMKKKGKVIPISLAEHLDLLALINETVGGAAGLSVKENLLPRIYRKWGYALPNLEEAPLFKVLGRRKEENGIEGKSYPFTEEEKDGWANLFAYIGSEEHIRVKFDVEKIGLALSDIGLFYGELRDQEAWEGFISHLRGDTTNREAFSETPVLEEPRVQPQQAEKPSTSRFSRFRRPTWVIAALVVPALIAWVIWKTFSGPASNQVASIDKMAYPLPDKPSIAVLPFDNLSGDPGQEFFCDGLTEGIITTLSKSPYLFVIARHSSAVYKGKPVTVKRVAEDLGIRYVLEGSVHRSGNRVRITAQLIDALKGPHLWAEQYDRDIKDIFTWQDEIALAIMKTLHVKLEGTDRADEGRGGTSNVEAYLKAMEARGHLIRYTEGDNAKARRLYTEALALDPHYPRPLSGLAACHAAEVWLGISKSPPESLKKAVELLNRGLALEPSDPGIHSMLAYLMAMTRQYEKAVIYADKALTLDPNSYNVLFNTACALLYSDRPNDAVPLLLKEQRLNPYAPALSHMILSWAYRMAGQYDRALEQAQKAVEKDKKHTERNYYMQVNLAGAYMLTGQETEGRAAAAEVLKINPKFSLDQYAGALPFKNRSKVAIEIEALRRAGLK